jgi:hypothetical protein
MDRSDLRDRAKSWTESAMRLPHPSLVQTWLLALTRLQCGQMVFMRGMIFPHFMYGIMPPIWRERKSRRAKPVLAQDAFCTGTGAPLAGVAVRTGATSRALKYSSGDPGYIHAYEMTPPARYWQLPRLHPEAGLRWFAR